MDKIQGRIWGDTYQKKPVYLNILPIEAISLISPETYTLLNKNKRYYSVNNLLQRNL